MAGRIPQQFIDELMTRVDIVEVIDARVPLRKAGRDYMARCPFHDEKTPSFTVSPEKQFYHCFGCGAHGTAIGFLMEYERLDFVEAVQELAARVGMPLPQAEASPAAAAPKSKDLYELLIQAATFYRRQLREHSQAKRAVDYLKGRGLSGEIAAEFDIGFAPAGWDNLLRALGNGAQARLVEAGLLVEKPGGGYYDRFRDRIMFPIRDPRGRVIGFGGRVLGDDTPKYLNSPETPVFHKGRELYGLYEARKALRQIDRLLVVEGYMDVVALAQFGIRYAVATLGTAITREHLERIFRVVPEVVFCFDGDRAGREAAWRAVENALPMMSDGRTARFMFLPEGEDPDTLVRKEGQEPFEARIANSVTLSEFFYTTLARQTDIYSRDGRARLVELARPVLSKVPDGAFRRMMLERLAEIARMDAVALNGLVGAGKTAAPARPRTSARSAVAPTRSPVRMAIEMLLYRPALACAAGDPRELAELDVAGADLLLKLLELLQAQPHLNAGAIIEHWRGTTEGRHLAALAQWSPAVPEGVDAEFSGTLRRLREQALEQRVERLLHKEKVEGLSAAEKDELRRLLPLAKGEGK
ncbi:MAG: DNA primase [Gammaproteobacteria bacterium]|nr:DNA primase [Gammaproteobacteria bacterium]